MTFTFTDPQLQYIVNTLVQRPYAEVFELIGTIQQQVQQQQQQKRETPEAPDV